MGIHNKHTGSNFHDFLREEGILEEVQAMTTKRILIMEHLEAIENHSKQYYARFKTTEEAIEVDFPDLPGCVTFGKDWDIAISYATDVLAAWLAHSEPQWIPKASSRKELEKKNLEKNNVEGTLVSIPVDVKILEQYLKRKIDFF